MAHGAGCSTSVRKLEEEGVGGEARRRGEKRRSVCALKKEVAGDGVRMSL